MRRMRCQLSPTDQVGFATTAKALLLVFAVVSGGFLVAGNTKVNAPGQLPNISENIIAAQAVVNDPDAELRLWLREAEPPSF
ncbi:MAG: hypothetical protein ACKVQU_04940 [Burkholderiales bacterium]